MSKLILFVGVAGSGKTSTARQIFSIEDNAVIISSDALRAELFGDENDQTHNIEVFDEMLRRTRAELKKGKTVIYDATNLSAKRRANLLKQLSDLDIKKECFVILTSFDDCVKRQFARERQVPEEVIRRQIKQFQCPDYWEGWDNINFVQSSHVPLIWFMEQNKIPHDNPHHTADVYKHMLNAGEEYIKRYERKGMDDVGYIASYYHDLGKYFCKEFKDGKGVSTKEAHYYGHQNVGAYFYLLDANQFNRIGVENSIKIANLIQWHMEFYLRDKKGLEKLKKQIGEEMFTLLERIYICDKAAH